MPQSYLIVGGSSDIALLLAESLLDDGHAVTLLARDSARCQTLENRGAELIQGDALDADLVQRAVQAGIASYFYVRGCSYFSSPNADLLTL